MFKKLTFTNILFFLILFLAFFLRFYKLGVNPPSLDWDEASTGYNAYSLLKTGKDEYGNFLPLSIRSFDDYKPPLYVYLTVPMIALFGLNELSVRLISAILGFLTVPLVFFLTKELLKDIKLLNEKKVFLESTALLCAFFIAVSPWHLQFSRAAFEGNIGLFFAILGFWLFLKALKKPFFLLLSVLAFSLSTYSYHSFRLIVPLFLFLLFLLFFKKTLIDKKVALISLIIYFLATFPVYKALAFDSSARFSMVTIFNGPELLSKSIERTILDQNNFDKIGQIFHNRRLVYLQETAKGYLDHFNPIFLFISGDSGRQHHAVNMGMLYSWELPFVIIGFVFLLNNLNRKTLSLLGWFVLSPLPSALTTGTPHPVRAIGMLLAFHVATALGVLILFLWLKKLKSKALKSFLIIFITITFLFNFSYYLHQYYVHTPVEYGDFWQYGYKDLFLKLSIIDKNYQKVVVTYKYDQPYIYYLFYNKIDPTWYQNNWDYLGTGQTERFKRVIGKYEFRNLNFGVDKNLKNTLLVGTKDDFPRDVKPIDEIRYLDGSTAFEIVKT